jgi:hypothetical protein
MPAVDCNAAGITVFVGQLLLDSFCWTAFVSQLFELAWRAKGVSRRNLKAPEVC